MSLRRDPRSGRGIYVIIDGNFPRRDLHADRGHIRILTDHDQGTLQEEGGA